jgi:hypothetical protein
MTTSAVSLAGEVLAARPYRNPLHAAEHAYLEALSRHGFGSPECVAAMVTLRRLRQAHRELQRVKKVWSVADR